jgi:hypothetical protein
LGIVNHASVSPKLQISLLVSAALAVAMVLALSAIVDQRKTIADLRAQIDSRASASLRSEPPEPSSGEPPAAPTPATIAAPPVPPVAEIPVEHTPTLSVEPGTLQKQNEQLEGQLRGLEAELAQTKRLVPEPDDPAAAYVGPGTWINANAQTSSITKIVITEQPPDGHLPRMRIAAWGRCSPTDCEWGEVPLFLLENHSFSKPGYRRGFAAWDSEGWTENLIVTFEKSGLKIECISVAKQRLRPHLITTERMIQLN